MAEHPDFDVQNQDRALLDVQPGFASITQQCENEILISSIAAIAAFKIRCRGA